MKVVVAQIAPVMLNPVVGNVKSYKRSSITCQQSPSNHQNRSFPSSALKRTHEKDCAPSALASDMLYIPPINRDYSRFEGNGVTFEEISLAGTNDNSLVLKMTLQNGSVAALMLPSGLITSYKTPLWHGGQVELLHTFVSKTPNSTVVNIQGGVSLAFDCEIEGNDDGSVSSWSPSIWDLSRIRGGYDQEFIKVELKSSNWDKTVEVKCIVTLREDVLTSKLVFSNKSSSSIRLMGSVISHLGVSTPDATYALGLEGSNFYSKPPLSSTFCITPPNYGLNKSKKWSFGGSKKGKQAEIADGEEDENYKQLTEGMCRIYTFAPSQLTIMDRGKRNSIIIGREGFEELYLFSPGSNQEWYGKFAYICVGQSALLQPITLAPGDKWSGAQHLHNPNL